jgi:phosphomannomutase / phosphoglucomutase
MLYFATHFGTGSGVEVTGSHNPPDYNGLKMVLAGETLHGESIQALRAAHRETAIWCAPVPGQPRDARRRAGYLERITGDVKLARPMKIAIDCGNGVAGAWRRRCTARSAAR